jgi:hypothetical protein
MKFFFGHGGMAMEKQPSRGMAASNAVLQQPEFGITL